MKHASHSSLSLYDRCPRWYKIERVEKRKAPPGASLKKGSAVHAGAAAYIRHLQAEGLQTDITWQGKALDAAREKMKSEGIRLAQEEWNEVKEVLDTFISSHVFEPSQIAEVEKMERIPLDGGIQFWGVIDLLEVRDGLAAVTDFKTDFRVRSQAEVERDPQLARYAWMVARLYGYEEVACRLDFVRYGAVREVTFGPAEISKVEPGILEAVEAIEADEEWNPTPGSHCSWCPWAEECTALSDLPVQPPRTDEEAERLGGEILVLEKRLKDRKAALSEWTAKNGSVVVGGQEFGHFESRSLKPDPAAFIELLGNDTYQYVSIDGRKLGKLLKDKDLGPHIEAISKESVSTSFKHKKVGWSE